MGNMDGPSLFQQVVGGVATPLGRMAGEYIASHFSNDGSATSTTNISNITAMQNQLKHPAPASSTKTVRRHKLKNGNSKGVDPHDVKKYPPVTIATPKQSLQLKSPFAQFKKWFDGSTTL